MFKGVEGEFEEYEKWWREKGKEAITTWESPTTLMWVAWLARSLLDKTDVLNEEGDIK